MSPRQQVISVAWLSTLFLDYYVTIIELDGTDYVDFVIRSFIALVLLYFLINGHRWAKWTSVSLLVVCPAIAAVEIYGIQNIYFPPKLIFISGLVLVGFPLLGLAIATTRFHKPMGVKQ